MTQRQHHGTTNFHLHNWLARRSRFGAKYQFKPKSNRIYETSLIRFPSKHDNSNAMTNKRYKVPLNVKIHNCSKNRKAKKQYKTLRGENRFVEVIFHALQRQKNSLTMELNLRWVIVLSWLWIEMREIYFPMPFFLLHVQCRIEHDGKSHLIRKSISIRLVIINGF